MRAEHRISRILLITFGLSFLFRAIIATMTELGNDEVYYVTYAAFPDWSHFDHPPMVGWLIQLFTINLHLFDEFFIRLGALLGGTLTAWYLYLTGRRIGDERTGLYAVFLFTASIYGFIISGVFILPDSGQMVFWTAALYYLTGSVTASPGTAKPGQSILLAGILIGLGMLSKYTTLMLWFSALAYILVKERTWLKSPRLYLAMAISLLLFLPVMIWNWQEDFVSFAFHGERVEVQQLRLRPGSFLTEVAGTLFYQNPINIILIVISLLSLLRQKSHPLPATLQLVLWCSLPLALLMPLVSWFRATLPHWSGPAYAGLILTAAYWLRERQVQAKAKDLLVPVIIRISLALAAIIFVVGIVQIRTGALTPFLGIKESQLRPGANDFSLDMYGWRQLGQKFKQVYENDQKTGAMGRVAVMLSWRWFPAANLDHYVASPLGIKLYAEGSLSNIHKYKWINPIRGPIPKGSDAYFISSSRDFADPMTVFGANYKTLLPPDTIVIERGGRRVLEFYIFRLKDRLN